MCSRLRCCRCQGTDRQTDMQWVGLAGWSTLQPTYKYHTYEETRATRTKQSCIPIAFVVGSALCKVIRWMAGLNIPAQGREWRGQHAWGLQRGENENLPPAPRWCVVQYCTMCIHTLTLTHSHRHPLLHSPLVQWRTELRHDEKAWHFWSVTYSKRHKDNINLSYGLGLCMRP